MAGYGEAEGLRRIQLPIEERIKGMSTPRAFWEIGKEGLNGMYRIFKEALEPKEPTRNS